MINPLRVRPKVSGARLLASLFAVLTMLISSCATNGIATVDVYDKSQFTVDQIAVLHVPNHLKIWALDGKDLGTSAFGRDGAAINLGTGKHVATVHAPESHGTPFKASFSVPSSGDYFIDRKVVEKNGKRYIQFHVHKCRSAEHEKLKQAHNATSYTRYENACPLIET